MVRAGSHHTATHVTAADLYPSSPSIRHDRLSMHLRRAATTQRTLLERRTSIDLTTFGTTAAE